MTAVNFSRKIPLLLQNLITGLKISGVAQAPPAPPPATGLGMEEVTNRKWKHFCAYLFSGKPHPVKFPFITLRAASWALWNANCSSTRILLYRQLIAHYPMLSHGSLTNFPAQRYSAVYSAGCTDWGATGCVTLLIPGWNGAGLNLGLFINEKLS